MRRSVMAGLNQIAQRIDPNVQPLDPLAFA